ncbi:hypothetical protein BBJ28_00001658 [Nothophytophthora sp. Chile5]|nr:hypothetical protein BBJ28_00001658 [Nothophytophthora sp. Chile5]
MASRRRGSVGLDGAESQCCDLSVRWADDRCVECNCCPLRTDCLLLQGRGLTSGQIERTLRVFATADTIDLSNNEIDKVPTTLPAEVVTLDLSFNLISSVSGIERLKFVQELHIGFNRLDDVSLLEFCPRLLRVNLSGNRYAIIVSSYSEDQKPGYHVPLLDMIPSVIILDDKKIRSASKFKSKEVSATKSLSYSLLTWAGVEPSLLASPCAARLYDDKKQFVIRKQTRPRPATTVRPILPGDSPTKYDSTMFLQPPIEPTYERTRANLQTFQQLPADTAPFSPLTSPSRVQSPAKSHAAPYMSLYDRLAKSNGIPVNKSCAPPSKPIFDHSQVTNTPNGATEMKLANGGQPASTRSAIA